MNPALPANSRETDLIVALWERLARVRSLAFVAAPGPESASGWAGSGRATVTARRQADSIVWRENGLFKPARGGPALAFRNVYRWRRTTAARLTLGHERFGADNAVFLLAFVDTGNGALAAAEPHRCGADRYTATLRSAGDGLDLSWRIVGPSKQERIDYRYR